MTDQIRIQKLAAMLIVACVLLRYRTADVLETGLLSNTKIANSWDSEQQSVRSGAQIYSRSKIKPSTLGTCDGPTYTGCSFAGKDVVSGSAVSIAVIDCDFEGCGTNGCIYITGGPSTINVTNSIFRNCSSANYGPAISTRGVANLTMTNVTCASCVSSSLGGAIYHESGFLELSNVTGSNCTSQYGGFCYLVDTKAPIPFTLCLTGCVADANGGGVYVVSGECAFHESTFTNCRAVFGGVVYQNVTGSSVRFSGITATGCTTEGDGGVFFISAGSLTGTSAEISSSEGSYGAVFYQLDGTSQVVIGDVKLSDCYASENGGCVNVNAGTCRVENCTMTDCKCRYMGGIFFVGSAVVVIREIVVNNFGGTYGGIVFLAYGECEIESGVFKGGSVVSGCIIYQYAPETVLVARKIQASHCSANIYGGFVTSENGNADIKACTLVNCSSSEQGGGIYQHAAGYSVVMSDITVESCESVLGGFFLLEMGQLILTNTTITRCSSDYGSILYQVNVKCISELANVTVSDSSSATNGGAFYGKQGVSLTLSGCCFVNCSSMLGGVIYNLVKLPILDISDCVFESCYAARGGSIVTAAVKLVMVNCQVINSSASEYGGVLVFNAVADAVIELCSFESCIAESWAALFYCASSSGNLVVSNCNAKCCICRQVGAVIYSQNGFDYINVSKLHSISCYGDRSLAGNVIHIETAETVLLELCMPLYRDEDIVMVDVLEAHLVYICPYTADWLPRVITKRGITLWSIFSFVCLN